MAAVEIVEGAMRAIPLSPTWFRRVADSTPNWQAILFGCLALWLGQSIFMFFALSGISEPYPDVPAMLSSNLSMLGFDVVFSAAMAIVIAAPFAATAFHSRWASRVRALAVGAFALLPVWSAWCFCLLCAMTHSPGFNIAVRPAWLEWGGWDWLGSPIWPLVGLGYLVYEAWLVGRDRGAMGDKACSSSA